VTTTEGYSVEFDERSRLFSMEPGRNQLSLTMWQSWVNDKLRAQGHLFLNEVFDSMGLPRTREGQLVGWLAPGHPECKAGFVNFGLDFLKKTSATGTIVLKFNVDGNILDALWPATS
jgi:hypothetical protein